MGHDDFAIVWAVRRVLVQPKPRLERLVGSTDLTVDGVRVAVARICAIYRKVPICRRKVEHMTIKRVDFDSNKAVQLYVSGLTGNAVAAAMGTHRSD